MTPEKQNKLAPEDSIYPRPEPEPPLPLTTPLLRLVIVTPNAFVAALWLIDRFLFIRSLHNPRVSSMCASIMLCSLVLGLLIAITQLRRARFAGFLLTVGALILALVLYSLMPV